MPRRRGRRRTSASTCWEVGREQDLADLSGFRGTPDHAATYYLGGHYRSRVPQSASFVGQWGLGTELADLRQVVLTARDHGRRSVVLGGRSWGAATALAYAAWDFNGHAGYQDLSGLVLLDGGVHDAFAGEGDTFGLTTGQAAAWLKRISWGRRIPRDRWPCRDPADPPAVGRRVRRGHARPAVAARRALCWRACARRTQSPTSAWSTGCFRLGEQ